jgi:ketosteroid isomerase-like protein
MSMYRTSLAALALLLACPFSPGQTGAGRRGSGEDEKVRAELLELHRELREAVTRHDRAALESLYAEEFFYVHSTGRAEGRAEWIARSLTVESARGPSPALEEYALRVFGDVAVATRRVPAVVEGRPNPRALWTTTIYVRRGGRWQIAQMQGTPIPEPREAAAVDAKTLDAYVGRYEYAPGDYADVTREGDALFSRRAGRGRVELVAEGDGRFFVKDTDSRLTFFKDAEGRVTHFTIRRGQRPEETAKKVK